jgi:pilus assembly protein CpaF
MLRFFQSVFQRKEAPVSIDPVIESQLSGISDFLEDDSINEIWVSTGHLIIRYSDGHTRVSHLGETAIDLVELIFELAEESCVRLDPFVPFAGGVVKGVPWRWHAVVPPIAPDGPQLCFRRQRIHDLRLDHFHLTDICPIDLTRQIKQGASVVMYGATGSGKTSFLGAMLREFFIDKRVVIAETIVEIPLLSPMWARLCESSADVSGRGGVDFERIVAEMMRLTPEYIVMGEIRGREARYLQSLARTGHGGILATTHASSEDEMMERLATLSGSEREHMPPIIGIHVRRSSNGVYEAGYRLPAR